jgi:hypothetical protein
MRAVALLGALAVLLLGLCSTAGASVQTVGVPLTAGPVGSTGGSGITATLLNLIIAEPRANAVSPVSGVIDPGKNLAPGTRVDVTLGL